MDCAKYWEMAPSFIWDSSVDEVTLSPGLAASFIPQCPAWDYSKYRMEINMGSSDSTFTNTHLAS